MMQRLASAALVLLLVPALATAQDTAPPDRQGGRVATQECARCHDREFQRLKNGAHRDVLHATALFGCETCHGPGALHANDATNDPRLITMPALLTDAQQTALCSKCHGDQVSRHGGDPQGFRIAGRSCTDCHAVHGKRQEPLLPGMRMTQRSALAKHASNVGTTRCIECHPLRDTLLAASVHASLAAANSNTGCELCHGEGSLHAEHGAGRLITRPDRSEDGIAVCRSCHAPVDATEFHWRGRSKPYLSNGVTCTTCHVVHAPAAGALVSADDHATPATNRTCAACHAAAFATMPGSTHQSLGSLDTPLAQGCGSCHAGSEEHARSGGRRDQLATWQHDARLQAEVCLSCHQDSKTLAHVRHGDHLRHGVRCTDCHGPLHGARHGEVTAAAELRCAGCHAAVAAEFLLPNHHPVPEQRMHCTSCHDVHGGRSRPFDLDLGEQRCVQCHAAYRGPFVFAHQAGRRDGCVVCHAPHGSTNRRLLKQATTQQNCLQCHGDFPAFHDQTSGAVFTNCIRCHTQVHGSNHSRYLFR